MDGLRVVEGLVGGGMGSENCGAILSVKSDIAVDAEGTGGKIDVDGSVGGGGGGGGSRT